jgi:GNAT superfamily N-acetyltransferase
VGTNDYAVRRAGASDVTALGRLGALLMRQHYGFDRQRFMKPGRDAEEGYGGFLDSQLEEQDAALFVAERGGRVIGYVYAAIEPLSWQELRDEAGFVHDLYVEEDARGGGVGAALLEAAVDWLRQRGQPRVLLWSAAPNEGAQRLFERRGFRRTMVEMTREL